MLSSSGDKDVLDATVPESVPECWGQIGVIVVDARWLDSRSSPDGSSDFADVVHVAIVSHDAWRIVIRLLGEPKTVLFRSENFIYRLGSGPRGRRACRAEAIGEGGFKSFRPDQFSQ